MERRISLSDIPALAIGAGVLGTGGGGNTYLGSLWLRKELTERQTACRLITVDEVPDDAYVCAIGGMGAPTVGIEKLPAGNEFALAVQSLEQHMGIRFHALLCGEIGGSNALRPLVTALQLDLPVVDGDGMGRAFPELQMDTFAIGGLSLSPMALADEHNNVAIFHHVDSPKRAEQYGRAVTIEMGGRAALAMPLMTGTEMRRTLIAGTYTLAQKIGDTVLAARAHNAEPATAVADLCQGRVLFRGKITDVERKTVQGFARGRIELVGFGETVGAPETFEVVFQNENLIAWHNGEVVCTVPDLICVLNLEDGEPIGTEMLRYGLRVAILGLPAPKELKTAAALAVVGPAAFGYPEVPFQPLPGLLL